MIIIKKLGLRECGEVMIFKVLLNRILRYNISMTIPSYIKKYFWDIDTKKARLKQKPEFFIKRILELGDKKAYKWAEEIYGEGKIAEVAKKGKLTPKSKNFWRLIFG